MDDIISDLNTYLLFPFFRAGMVEAEVEWYEAFTTILSILSFMFIFRLNIHHFFFLLHQKQFQNPQRIITADSLWCILNSGLHIKCDHVVQGSIKSFNQRSYLC